MTAPAAPAADPAPGASPRHRIAALTGLRAVAALMVAATHAFFWTGNYTDDAFGRFGARLEVSVPIFFALSGFLLTRPWVRAGRRGGASPRTARYLRRRARRILPAYWITVTVVYLVYTVREAGPFGQGWDGYLRNMTLTQIYGYGHLHESLTQMWTLAVEAAFYLLLPLFGWVLVRALRPRGPDGHGTGGHGTGGHGAPRPRTGRALGWVAALGAVSPLWIAATHTDGFYSLPGISAARVDVTAQLWLPSFLLWFAAGMAVAVLEPALRERGWPARPGLFTAASLGAAAAAFALACTPLAGEGTIMPAATGPSVVKNLLYAVCAAGVLAPLALARRDRPPGLYTRALAWRPVVWLGTISYEFFLIHLLVMDLMMDALGYPPFHGSITTLFEATVVATLPAAWLLARLTRPRTERRARYDTAPAGA